MEGFWGILKSESFYGLRFNDEKTLRRKIEEYIYIFITILDYRKI